MGLVTLACVSCVTGIQLEKKLRMIKCDDTKMEDDAITRLFCVTCEDLDKVTKPSIGTNFVKELVKSSGRIPKISSFESIPLITFVPVQVYKVIVTHKLSNFSAYFLKNTTFHHMFAIIMTIKGNCANKRHDFRNF